MLLALFTLTVVPTVLSYLVAKHQAHQANICFVRGSTENVFELDGIYRQRNEGFSVFQREAPFAGEKMPTLTEMGSILAPPTRSDKGMTFSLLGMIADVTTNERGAELRYSGSGWCISSPKMEAKLCSVEKGERRVPSAGAYSNDATAVYVSCLNPEMIQVDKTMSATEASTSEDDADLQKFVLYRPASAVLAVIMLFLAYKYSTNRTPLEAVAMSYDSVVNHWEFWRVFTSCTAHLDATHLVMNMFSLYTLGSQLEEWYGSVPFLLYNVSLIPITSIITMVLIELRTDVESRQRRARIVGFSGVLFAWSTVAALRLPISFPFHPFMKDLYFKTHAFGPLKLNAGPFVRMIAIQVLVPSSSFDSHLAGIISGGMLHIGLLPLKWVQPALLLPAILFLHFYYVRGVLSFTAIEQVVLGDPSPMVQDHRRFRTTFRYVRLLLVIAMVMGCAVLDETMTVQLALVVLFIISGAVSHVEDLIEPSDHRERHSKKNTSSLLWRAIMLVCLVSVLQDCATLGSWMSCGSYFFANQIPPTHLQWTGVPLLLTRIGLQVASLALALRKYERLSGRRMTFGGITI
jgi:membrane associated rhomboid family serine protease